MSDVITEQQFVPDKFLLMERKYELAIEQLKEEFSQQIVALNSQINSLTAEVSSLRIKLDDVKSVPVSNPEPQQKLVVEVPPPPASAEKKEHPRQGSFKSEDVPIDKYFYFGNKKF